MHTLLTQLEKEQNILLQKSIWVWWIILSTNLFLIKVQVNFVSFKLCCWKAAEYLKSFNVWYSLMSERNVFRIRTEYILGLALHVW